MSFSHVKIPQRVHFTDPPPNGPHSPATGLLGQASFCLKAPDRPLRLNLYYGEATSYPGRWRPWRTASGRCTELLNRLRNALNRLVDLV